MPPLVLITAAWIAGLIAARCLLVPVGVEPLSLALLGVVALAAVLLWRKDRRIVLSGACALAFLGGAVRYQTHIPRPQDPASVASFNGLGWVTLEGVVDSYPDERDARTNLELEAEWIEVEGQAYQARGRVLVQAPRFPEVRYGDRLRVSGLLRASSEVEDRSYREYLAQKGIYSIIRRPRIEPAASGQGNPFWMAMLTVKDHARGVIARLLPEPEASLLQGILLGIRSGIPDDLYDDYKATGTSHIIVISGANIVIVAGLFSLTFGRLLGRRRGYWFTMAGILLYVLLVGADPVVVRAGVMGGLFVTALYLGRRATAYVSLAASAIFLTLLNPLALWNVGFQLSAAATLGLILFTAPMEQALQWGLTRVASATQSQTLTRLLSSALIVTLAAQILTLPLILHHFDRLSLVSPLANLFILPVQPHIMVWGGAATLIGLVPQLEPVARLIATVPWLCLAYTNAIVRWMATWPSASLELGSFHVGWLVAYYGLLFAGLWLVGQRKAGARRLWKGATERLATRTIGGLLLVAAVMTLLAILQLPDGRLHVAFLDVGQGDAILITTPRGQQVLVDGGPGPTALTPALGREMPFWDHSLDLLVLTHADADHVSGLVEVLKRFQVDGWLDNGLGGSNAAYLRCQELLDEAGVAHYVAQAGDRLELEQGIVMEVLHPTSVFLTGAEADSNSSSLVLRLVWGQANFLLTGDLEAEGERHLIQSGQPLSADVLKVGHHGSGGASTRAFLAAVAPGYAVISAGADNNFNHPDPAVLERLAQIGNIEILRTDTQGTVEFVTDGQRLWVRTER